MYNYISWFSLHTTLWKTRSVSWLSNMYSCIIMHKINSVHDFCVCTLSIAHAYWRKRYIQCHNIIILFHSSHFTHIISELPMLISTFVLVLVVLNLSFIDWRCNLGVFYNACKYEYFTYSYGKQYTIRSYLALNSQAHSYLALNSTYIISELPNLISTFVQMLVVLYLTFNDCLCDWGVFCIHKYMRISHAHTITANGIHNS